MVGSGKHKTNSRLPSSQPPQLQAMTNTMRSGKSDARRSNAEHAIYRADRMGYVKGREGEGVEVMVDVRPGVVLR